MYQSYIETIVNKDFLLGSTIYHQHDIFIYDENNSIHKKLYLLNKIKFLNDSKYNFVCNVHSLIIDEKEYKLNEIIEDALSIPTIKSLVKIGKIRKEITIKLAQNVKDRIIKYYELAKKYNMPYVDFKEKIKTVGVTPQSHLSIVFNDEFEKITKLFEAIEE